MHESAYTFPADWDTRTIGDIACHVGSGITPTGGSSVYSKTGITFIRSQNVTFKGLQLNDVAFIEPKIHQQMARSEIFPHDVLLNITGASIGRCCFVPDGFGIANVNQHVCAIRLPQPSHEDAVFLSGVLASHIGQSQIDHLNAGGNREGLNYQHVRSFVVPWPRPLERKRIAAVLEAVDEAIANTEVVIAKLKHVRAGFLHNLLTRGIDEHGQLRDPIAHSEQFQDSPLGRIPRIWMTKPLHQAAKVIDSLHRTPGFSVEGLPMVRVTDIKGGYLQLSECARVEPQVYEEFTTNHKPRRGDIVLSRVGSYGISSLADTDEPFCMGQNTVIVTEHSNPRFLHEVLQSEPLRRQFEFAVAGSSQKTLSLRAIREALIPDPPTEEQARIADLLQAFTSQSAEEMAFLAKLGKLKSGLMADLLTGRVRVPEESPVAP